MPGGIPRWIRVYDNGGGFTHFCPRCLSYCDADDFLPMCPTDACNSRKLIPVVDPGTADRYTVMFTGRYRGRQRGFVDYVAMSCHPTHPQGVCYHGEIKTENADCVRGYAPSVGRYVAGFGRRIPFAHLPEACRKVVVKDYMGIWGLDPMAQMELPNIQKNT